MKIEEIIQGFGELSEEDQVRVRAELLGKPGAEGAAPSCCSEAMKQHMGEMMAKMESSENPMAMCQEMMRMCQEKMGTLAGKCAS